MPQIDWFENSVAATRAHRQFCIDLSSGDKPDFPGCYSENIWGITASDSAKRLQGMGSAAPHHYRWIGCTLCGRRFADVRA